MHFFPRIDDPKIKNWKNLQILNFEEDNTLDFTLDRFSVFLILASKWQL